MSNPRCFATVKMSLSPRPHMFMTIRWSFGRPGAIFITWASAWLGSSAGNDALQLAAKLERLQRLGVGDADIFRAAHVVQPGMFRPDAGIVEPGRDRVALEDLAVGVLQQIGAVAVQHAGAAAGQAGAMLHPVIDALAARLDPDDAHRRVVEEREEQPHRVRPAADGGDDRVGQAAFALLHLGTCASLPMIDWKSRTIAG